MGRLMVVGGSAVGGAWSHGRGLACSAPSLCWVVLATRAFGWVDQVVAAFLALSVGWLLIAIAPAVHLRLAHVRE